MATTKRTAAAQRIGYRRVSTVIQSTARQLADVDLDREFTDKASGSSADRPQLTALLMTIRAGDEVHVHSIDRLARNLQDLLALVEQVTEAGASLHFHSERLVFGGDGSDALARMQLGMMGAFASFERELINERAAEGRVAAKARGVRFGRPCALTAKQIATVRKQHAAGKSVSKIAIDHDVSRQSIYRVLERAA